MKEVKVYLNTEADKPPKKHIDRVAIPNMIQTLRQLRSIKKDVKDILDSGLARATVARSLGVSTKTVWNWEKGVYYPRDQFILLCVMEWAKQIREENSKKDTSQNHTIKIDKNHAQKDS